MFHSLKIRRAGWLVLGVLIGLVIGGLLPQAPLHAVATDREENFAICTGPVDSDVEGIFFLDFVTGDLKAAILNPNTGTFTAAYERNILADLGVDASKNPRYLMVTGLGQLRTRGQMQYGASILYVAELTSGKCAAYGVPFNKGAFTSGGPYKKELVLLQVIPFRTAVIR